MVERNLAKVDVARSNRVTRLKNLNRPFGEAAKNQLQSLLPIGSLLSLREINRDRDGRTVAEVYRNQESVNLAMVKTVHAVIYRRYFDGCKRTQNQFNQAEMKAKVLKRELWKQSDPVIPWVYHKWKNQRKFQ